MQSTGKQRWPARTRAWMLITLVAVSIAPAHSASAANTAPALMFVTRAGHSLAVAGKNWGHHVIATAQIGASSGVAAFGTVDRGKFTIAVDFSVACGGITVKVRDFRGHHATLKRSGPLCPNRVGESPPAVTVLLGVPSKIRAHTIGYASTPRTLTMHVGETLKITERRDSAPSFLPAADTQHFLLLEQGGPGSASCMAACVQTGDPFWEWVAMKGGNGTVNLSPSCRQSRPPCELAEPTIEVTITA
jgi:hypothetical protein